MRNLLLALALVAGVQAYASTTDQKTVSFVGGKTEETVVLNTEKTHTEHRYETVQSTCYRQEFVGYRQQCDYRYETVCDQVRECHIVNNIRECHYRPVCHSVPRYYCYQVPEYRNVAYTCDRVLDIPYEVKDYNVEASVKLVYGTLPAGLKVNENFRATLVGENLKVEATNNASNVLIYFDKTVNESVAGQTKHIDSTYTLTFVPLTDLTSPLNREPGDVAVEGGDKLTFTTAVMPTPELFDIEVVVKKTKFLSSEKVGESLLAAEQSASTVVGGKQKFVVSFDELGFTQDKREKGGYKVELKLKAQVDSARVMNSFKLPKTLEVSGKGKFKL